jgi:hypothetical protein
MTAKLLDEGISRGDLKHSTPQETISRVILSPQRGLKVDAAQPRTPLRQAVPLNGL